MLLLYFLDNYIHLVKYLQTVPLDVSINLRLLSASRCTKKLFRNIKYEIILEVFKSNHLQAYGKEGKEYWRLSRYKRIIREDHQNCLFDKREISYDKPRDCKKRWEKQGYSTIH